jgi:hypothetical protein
MPITAHIVAMVINEARRKYQRMSAGKAPISLTVGISWPVTSIATTYRPTPESTAAYAVECSATRTATRVERAAKASETSRNAKYQLVRSPMVSPLPTAGGVAGYFMNGTRANDTKPINATVAVDCPGVIRPSRPTAAAASRATMPPSAVPTTRVPVSRPHVRWLSRETVVPSSPCVWPSVAAPSSCSGAAAASSRAMAVSTWGSPTWWATRNVANPARRPTSSPLTSRARAVMSVTRSQWQG